MEGTALLPIASVIAKEMCPIEREVVVAEQEDFQEGISGDIYMIVNDAVRIGNPGFEVGADVHDSHAPGIAIGLASEVCAIVRRAAVKYRDGEEKDDTRNDPVRRTHTGSEECDECGDREARGDGERYLEIVCHAAGGEIHSGEFRCEREEEKRRAPPEEEGKRITAPVAAEQREKQETEEAECDARLT